MAAVADSAYSERDELYLIEAKYSNCVIVSMTDSCSVDNHKILIPDGNEQSYYLFLLDRSTAVYSGTTFRKFDEVLLRNMKTATA